MAAADLTAQRLRELLDYDLATGVFRWKAGRRKMRDGAVAGSKSKGGYVRINLRPFGVFSAHRLAFLMVTGDWPTNVVDHIDGDCANNAWRNLRDVSRALNSQNQRTPHAQGASGFLGVSLDKRRGTWGAFISTGGRLRRIGTFKTPEAAAEAYLRAKREDHPGCTA